MCCGGWGPMFTYQALKTESGRPHSCRVPSLVCSGLPWGAPGLERDPFWVSRGSRSSLLSMRMEGVGGRGGDFLGMARPGV